MKLSFQPLQYSRFDLGMLGGHAWAMNWFCLFQGWSKLFVQKCKIMGEVKP